MRNHLLILWVLCVLSGGCSRPTSDTPKDSNSAATGSLRTYDEKVPPSGKEIIQILLLNQNVPLSVDPSCSGVGTDQSDSTIGDYISGFLAEQTSQKGKNWLDVSVSPESAKEISRLWKCSVVIRHVNGEDQWGWGVSFLIDAKDHKALEQSFRCTGAG